MVFPADPLDVVTELYIGGDWTDVSSDVLLRDGITITRGRSDEAQHVDPSSCSLSIRNTAGKYSPRNPRSVYFGTFGRNTPVRLAVNRESDDFGRTETAGWGSTAGGDAWSVFGLGGTVADSDFAVDGSAGTHSVPATSAFRATALESLSYRDVEVAVTCTISDVTAVTGGDLEPATILLRGQSETEYYQCRVQITTAGAVGLVIRDPDDVAVAAATVSGLTWSGQSLRVRAGVDGRTIRMRVWDASGDEPRDWQVSVSDDSITDAGWVGVRSGVASGNTNTSPVVFSYDDLVVRLPRFAGEVSAWPPRWDVSGSDVWVPITAAGIGRRLGQGAAPLRSALYREMTKPDSVTDAVAYWPCEDGSTATQVAAGLDGVTPMRISASGVQLAASTGITGSEPLPVLSAGGQLVGLVPDATDGAVYYRQVVVFPDAGTLDDGVVLASIHTTGTVARWDLAYGTGGTLSLTAYDAYGTTVDTTGAQDLGVDALRCKLEVDLVQSGSDVDIEIAVRLVAADGVTVTATSWAQKIEDVTVGHATRVVVGPAADLSSYTVGHIGVGTSSTFGAGIAEAIVGSAGETAGNRIERLTTEESVEIAITGDPDDTDAMGPQRTASLLDLLRDAEDVDGGVLYEARPDIALAYRTRPTLYNQGVALALDYTVDGDVAPPLEPTDDDQHVRNDVTITRTGGSSARYQRTDGPLSTSAPPDGVGVYDEQVTLDVAWDWQVRDQAAWRVHLGTWDEARYPTVHVDLAAGPTHIPAAAAVDVRDRITISNPPDWLPPGDIDLLCEGYTEALSAFDWDMVFNASPAGPWTVGVLEDFVLGRLDTDGSELTSDITSTATSISVTTTVDPVWIVDTFDTASTQFGILVGGEVMTVTEISGATSPQTFTVVRGANGVAIAHDAGTPVSLADPMRLAL